MLLWNSRDRVRALRTQKPATRNAFGKSFGPMKTSATTPISINSDQPKSRNIGSRSAAQETHGPSSTEGAMMSERADPGNLGCGEAPSGVLRGQPATVRWLRKVKGSATLRIGSRLPPVPRTMIVP